MNKKIRSLQDAKVLQDKMKKDANHVIGILNYWIEFIGRGESPTHSTFYDNEQKNLLKYIASIISTFTGDKIAMAVYPLNELKDRGFSGSSRNFTIDGHVGTIKREGEEVDIK